MKRRRPSSVRSAASLTSLTATCEARVACSARHTAPIPPWPSFSTKLYLPAMRWPAPHASDDTSTCKWDGRARATSRSKQVGARIAYVAAGALAHRGPEHASLSLGRTEELERLASRRLSQAVRCEQTKRNRALDRARSH